MKELRKIAAIETHENVKIEYETANVGSRMLAYILDMIILYGTLVIVGIVIICLAINDLLNFDLDIDASFGNVFLYIAIFILVSFLLENFYFIFFERILKGQSPGKKAMRLRVVMTTGEPVSFVATVVRNFFRIADELPASNLVGGLLVFFGRHSQRLGDRIANTMVVKTENLKKFSKYIDKLVSETEKPAADPSGNMQQSALLAGEGSALYKDRTFESEKALVREYLTRKNELPQKTAEEYGVLLFRVISEKMREIDGEQEYPVDQKHIPEFLWAFSQGDDASIEFTAGLLSRLAFPVPQGFPLRPPVFSADGGNGTEVNRNGT